MTPTRCAYDCSILRMEGRGGVTSADIFVRHSSIARQLTITIAITVKHAASGFLTPSKQMISQQLETKMNAFSREVSI